MRSAFLTLALLALYGCAADAYNVGAGSTGPLTTDPDPFELLGRDLPMGMRVDLASARRTPSGADLDLILQRFVRHGAPGQTTLFLSLLERTDLAVFGLNPGASPAADEVVIVRGRFADVDVEARWAEAMPLMRGEHRGHRILQSAEVSFTVLDDRLLVLGDVALVTGVIDRYLDRTRAGPGSPAVAASWDFEDTQLIAVALPTERIRDEMRRSPPFESVANDFERMAIRVIKTEIGELLEARVETSSPTSARAFSQAVHAEIDEVARNPYAEVTGLSNLLRGLRVEVDDGNVRVVGETSDASLAGFARRYVEIQ